jgi:hypothetical protein
LRYSVPVLVPEQLAEKVVSAERRTSVSAMSGGRMTGRGAGEGTGLGGGGTGVGDESPPQALTAATTDAALANSLTRCIDIPPHAKLDSARSEPRIEELKPEAFAQARGCSHTMPDGTSSFALTCVNGDRADLRSVRFQLSFVSRGAAREGRIGYAGAVPDVFCGRRFLFSACHLN